MMETIRVNMTPCEDIKTIHASQNDNEAREWGFELHNNGEKIDSSSISDQLVFKAYEGGTEQLLPENTSTPTTSPFLGDIRYPQGLLADQEFTYRQSPTESDGLAKITDIKGNTLVWNQYAKVANSFTSTTINGITLSKVDNHLHIEGTATDTATFEGSSVISNDNIKFVRGHKYFLSINSKNIGVSYGIVGYGVPYNEPTIAIVRPASAGSDWNGKFQFKVDSGITVNSDIYLQAIDLTQMFGSGNEPSTVEQFTSLFPLSYYSYNQGTLLSFMGNGIKTVGKNLLNVTESGSKNRVTITIENGEVIANGTPNSSNAFIIGKVWLFANNIYTLSGCPSNGASGKFAMSFYDDEDLSHILATDFGDGVSYTPTVDGYCYVAIRYWYNYTLNSIVFKPQVEKGSVVTEFEVYTSSTLSLPISTYFPNGMKSAGSVYDELTESKAITRVGSVDLGSLNWTYQSSSGNMYVDNVVSNRKNNLGFNAICSKYQQVNEDTISGVASLIQDKSFAFQYSFNGRIIVRDTSYTDATVFKQAMADQNVKLYYELATPTETSFTTASLVTENAEIPLSNEDGTLIGKCTEQLSENPGFFDAKIKLTDSDGECYSNKLQLHVERSPQ